MRLLGRLKNPHILRILGYHREEENLYLMLEYAENGSLLKLVKTLGKLPEELACVYVREVLEALAYLHGEGVIHRDLKAANILLNKAGSVKLADFGVAAVMGDADKHFTVVGSPYWMAPEVIEATGHSTLSDVWSLGCTVVELLTGEPPNFGLNPMTAMFKIVQEPAPIPPGVSAPMHAFLEACFQKDPARRPPARDLLAHPLFARASATDANALRLRLLAQHAAPSTPAGAGAASPTASPTPAPSALLAQPSPSTPSSSPTTASGSTTPRTPVNGRTTGARAGSLRARERCGSRLPIPEYQIERPGDDAARSGSSPGTPRDADGDDASDSESSQSHGSGSGSGFVLQRKSLDLRGRGTGAPGASPLAEISITLDASAMESARLLSASGRGPARSPALSPSPLLRSGTGATGTTAGNTGRTTETTTTGASGAAGVPRFRTLPRGLGASARERLSRDEEAALEVEALKQQLLALEKSGCNISAVTERVTGSVRSTKAELLQQLTPTLFDAGKAASRTATGTSAGAERMHVSALAIVGSVLWVGSTTGEVATYQLPRLELVRACQLHRTRVGAIVAVGASRVWCSSEEGALYVAPRSDPAHAKAHAVHDAEHRAVRALAFVPGDKPRVWSCAAARRDSQIVVLNKRCQTKYRLTIQESVSAVALAPAGDTVWLGCRASIIACDAQSGDLIREIRLPSTTAPAPAPSPSSSPVGPVTQLLPVGDHVWCAAQDRILVYSPATFAPVRTVALDAPVSAMAIFESAVLAGTADANVAGFDAVSALPMHTLRSLLSDPAGTAVPVAALVAVQGSLLAGRTGVPALFAASPLASQLCVWKTPA